MVELHPCPACHRHVASTEPGCPFCGATLATPARRELPFGRFSRAAVFAGAALATAACGGKAKPEATNNQLATPPVADAGVTPTPPTPDAAEPQAKPDPVPDHHHAKPYGAPPARRRLV